MIDPEYLRYLETFLTPERISRFKSVLAGRTNHFSVAVEDVYQLHNTSAVMRSCEVFGIQQLSVIEARYGKRIDKEIAMGAQKWVDVSRFESGMECVAHWRSKGYRIVATAPDENAEATLANFDISEKAVLFFGTERTGLSDDILNAADERLFIPMYGFTESLNVSVAAAIVLQNLSERLRTSNVAWQLSEQEILEKRLDWAEKSIKDIDRIRTRFFSD